MAEKAALIVLSIRANKHGKCWPSYQKIASDASMSVATAKRSVKSLVDKNLLIYEAGMGKSNQYVLNLDLAHSDTTGVNNLAHSDTKVYHSDTIGVSHRHPNIPRIDKSNKKGFEVLAKDQLTSDEMKLNREEQRKWAVEAGLIKD